MDTKWTQGTAAFGWTLSGADDSRMRPGCRTDAGATATPRLQPSRRRQPRLATGARRTHSRPPAAPTSCRRNPHSQMQPATPAMLARRPSRFRKSSKRTELQRRIRPGPGRLPRSDRAKMGCALSKANYDPVAINEVRQRPRLHPVHALVRHEAQIYVLFPDQTWQAYLDTWSEGEPEISCNPLNVPPTSPPLPRRGFGKLWCTVEGLKDKLGTIEREERLCQHTVVQRFDAAACSPASKTPRSAISVCSTTAIGT